MEKKTPGNKKGLKLTLLIVGILVLAAAIGLGLWFLLGNQEEAVTGENHVTIYWNVDRLEYVAANSDGTSGRYPRGDGYYYIRMAANGEQEDYMVQDFNLVNRIDLLDYCNLVFDENGVVVDVRTVEECTGGLVAPKLYIKSVEGNKVVANTQGNFLGVDITFETDEETEVYNVGGGTVLAGVHSQLQVDDEIIAIKDLDGTVGTVFSSAYVPVGDIYWNIYRKYDSTSKTTTREPNDMGYYEFEMALNGEVVTLRTRDYKVANNIDAQAAKCMAFTFDEDGNILTREATAFAGTSGTFGSWYHVTDFNENTVTAERIAAGTDQGNVMVGTFAPNCKIIDVSALGGYSGAYTELRVGDQIHGLRDSRGRIAYIFVHVRLSDETMPLYWNVTRKYSSTTGTTRTPDANGWYYAEVTTAGQEPITVKTQDKSLMDTLDSHAARCFTMKLKGDNEIVSFGSASGAHGGTTFGSWYYVDKVEGDQITVSRILTGDSTPTVVTGTMSPDIEIINGTTNFESHCGEYTELQVGDRVHGLTDLRKQVRVLFVVDRPVDVPVYWNLTRNYNSTTKQTTKVPDADGFYWFTFAVNGEQVKLKTRSKEMATQIDANAACCWGLNVWNGEITKVHSVSSVKGYSGGTKSISWVDVVRISGQNVVCQKNQTGHAQDGNTFNTYIGNNCKIYDVSTGYENYAGEPTTLRVGDRIHALHDSNGIAMIIWVVGGRAKPMDTKPSDCVCAEGAQWEPWDGIAPLKDGCYYYLTNDVIAPTEGFILNAMEVHLRLDGHTISSDGRVFYTESGGKLHICDHGTRGKLVGTGVSGESGGVIRMYSGSGNAVINLWNIDVVCNADSTPAKEGGAISCAGPMSLYNVNVIDGVASGKGGNITVTMYGFLRMFGGTLQNGNAKGGAGGNLNVEGVLYLEDVTMTGGKASGSGDNLYMTGATYEKRIDGLTATGGDVTLNAGKVGVLGTIKADLTMNGGTQLNNMGLSTDSAIKLTMKSEGTILSDAETDLSGVFTNTDTTGDYVITYDAKTKEVFMDYTVVPVPHSGNHCVCAGADTGLADHTCSTLTDWTEITKDVFETAMGTNNASQGIKFKKDGNYYLSTNYTLTSQLCIMPDQNITICLNGNQLRNGSRCGMIAGNLTVTDCVGSGQVYSTNNNTNGNTFKIVAGGQLDIYGGTFTSTASCTDGGVVVVSQDKGNIAPADSTEPGVFNMYGGTIKDGSATNGGNVILWHTSVFNMYGGTISGGTATASGENLRVSHANTTANLLGGTIKNGDVYITAGKVNVGGSMKIDELVANGNKVTVSDKGLAADAAISMAASAAGTLVSNVGSADYTKFNFVDLGDGIAVKYDAAQKAIVAEFTSTHNHCICGGVKPAGHSCATAEWMPLNATTVSSYFAVSSSRYVANSNELYLYLTEDLDLSYSINLNDGQTIHLCLNGFDLKHTKTANPVMRVWGDLDITDCSADRDGQIVGYRTGESPCLYVQNWVTGTEYTTPTVNLYAGTLTAKDGDTSTKAGVMQIGNQADTATDNLAVFNMYGGTIKGGHATNGGNVHLGTGKSVFNMYGGTITGGTATSSGGGIYATGGATMNILGGTITGNTAGANGDDIYALTTTKVTLGGTITIGEYYSNSVVLQLQNLNAASSIKLMRNADASALFATGADTDVSKCFTNPSLTAVWDSAAKTLTFVSGGTTPTPPPVVETDHKHCICGGTKPENHTCSDMGFIELKQADFTNATTESSPVYLNGTYYALRDGAYYLGENITNTKGISNADNANVVLCINGKTLTSSTSTIFTKGTIAFCDCTGNGIVTSTSSSHAPTMYVRVGCAATIYGGNFKGSKLGTSATTGGGCMIVGGELSVYGGKIYGGDASATTKNGGNVAIMDSGVMKMYGGTIEGGKVANSQSGGNVRVDTGTFYLYGGTIKGGTANEGGNIAIGSNGTMYVSGGVIEGGRAISNGGNIAVFGVLNISGGTIKDGVSGINGKTDATGGNITTYANKSAITMTGGTVENGSAPIGGNIALRTTGSTKVSLTVTGGEIKGGGSKSVNVANYAAITVTVGGDAKIDCIYLGGVNRRVTISTSKPLTAAASIGIAAAGEQTVVDGVTSTTGLKAYDSSYELVAEDANLVLKAKA